MKWALELMFNHLSRIISSINRSLAEMETENNLHNDIEQEFMSFGERKRLEIWKSYLRKQMDSLKTTIADNMTL